MRNKVLKNILIVMMLLAGHGLFSGIRMERFKNGATDCIGIENEFYSIVLVPDYGGRIFKWKNKISGITFTDEEIPDKPGLLVDQTGILDDRGNFRSIRYSAFPFSSRKDVIVLYLKGVDPRRKLTVERKMTFRSGSPVMEIRYKYSNESHTAVSGFDLGQRNFFRVNGGKVTPDDMYFIPTTHAVRRVTGKTFRNGGAEMAGKLMSSIGAEWHAFLSRKNKTGIAVHHNDNWYSGWYAWKGGVDFPTYEWMFGDLEAGYSRETSFDLIQTDGFDAVSYASKELLADLRLTHENGRRLAADLKVKVLSAIPPKAVLTTSIRKVASRWRAELKPIPFKGEMFRQTLPLQGEGLYVIEQKVTRGKQLIARWYDSLAYGKNIKHEAVFTPQYACNTDPEMVPGWSAPPKIRLDFSADATERRFAVSFPNQDNVYTECRELKLKLARNEFESRSLVLYPLDPYGSFTYSCKAPEGIGVRILPEIIFRWRSAKMGTVTRLLRILIPQEKIETETPTGVWLVFDTSKAKAGKYRFPVVFKNAEGKTAQVEITLEVSPVVLPQRKLVMMESEVAFPKNVMKDPVLLEAWMQNMTRHSVDFLQLGGAPNFQTDSPEMEIARKNISSLEKKLELALASGLTRVKTSRYSKTMPDEKEHRNWIELGKLLRAKGYQDKDIFVKILDEQPPDQFPVMAEMAKWLKAAGFRPFSTFSTLFAHPEQLRILDPYFDLYQGGVIGPETIAARRKDGSLKPGDLFGEYTGWGACWQSYRSMLYHGLKAAFAKYDFFHNHEYMRSGNARLFANIIRVGENSLPQDSPAHEGLRDGMEFANLAALCRQWIELLEQKKDFRTAAGKARKKYDRIFNGIFKRKPFKFMDLSDCTIEPVSEADYQNAHDQLLGILEEINAAAAGQDFAKVSWNDLELYRGGRIFKADGPGSESFSKAFRDYFRLEKTEAYNGIRVIFQIGKADGLTYKIVKDKNRVMIEAPTEEDLRRAGDIWIRTMDAVGLRF